MWIRIYSHPPVYSVYCYKFVNTLFSLLFSLYTVFWATLKFRPIGLKSRHYFFGFDFRSIDTRDAELLENLMDGGPQLLILRHEKFDEQQPDIWKGRDICQSQDGALAATQYFECIGIALKDGYRLWRQFGDRPPAVYYQIAAFPYRRIVYRAFFSKFKIDNYWGRDPYNVEHVLRRGELKRIGGKFLGVSVSFLTTSAILWP